ncbi:MAG: thioredoxin domain-containing protein [Pseudonocardiaceae bacterium]
MPSGRASRRRTRPVVAGRRGPSTAMIVAVVVLVFFAGAVGFGIYRAQQGNGGPLAVPPGATATGVPIGSPGAPATVDLYLDFQCPVCNAYEQQSGATINQLVASGAARVVYHPVAFLDRNSSTRYSSRSSVASGCAAAARVFSQFVTLLYANQPPEGGDGLPTDRLVALGLQAGAGPGFADCVTSNKYAPWTAAVTDAASRSGVNATPTVRVGGKDIDRTDQALRQAVQTTR